MEIEFDWRSDAKRGGKPGCRVRVEYDDLPDAYADSVHTKASAFAEAIKALPAAPAGEPTYTLSLRWKGQGPRDGHVTKSGVRYSTAGNAELAGLDVLKALTQEGLDEVARGERT